MAVSDQVPVVEVLDAIYSSDGARKNDARWEGLISTFKGIYNGTAPDFIARAPGRVNLIGEHIDYVGYSVFPAAIEKDILMATKVHYAAPGTAAEGVEVVLHNTTPRFVKTRFTSRYENTDDVVLLNEGDERWANYFKVVFKGLHNHLPPRIIGSENAKMPVKIEVLVDGTIPPESSLSSSAAMTTCSSIVVLQSFDARGIIDRKEMAEVAIESERLVGVNSGGMDQSASIFSIPKHALYISFYPTLTVKPTPLPPSEPENVFVIANTLIVSDKKVTGPVNYNLRLVETRMAARALGHYLGLSSAKADETKTLRGVQEAYLAPGVLEKEGDKNPEVAAIGQKYGPEAARLKLMEIKVEEAFSKEGLTRSEVEQATGYAGADFDAEFLSSFPIRADTFALYARAKHVFTEALRVILFESLCSSTQTGGGDVYASLGKLMDESQVSLRDLYNCSCAEIDQVITIAKQNGSLGSRLTGAGWGGCTVHLVPKPQVKSFIASLRQHYYAQKFPDLSESELQDACFDTQPAGGACLFQGKQLSSW